MRVLSMNSIKCNVNNAVTTTNIEFTQGILISLVFFFFMWHRPIQNAVCQHLEADKTTRA